MNEDSVFLSITNLCVNPLRLYFYTSMLTSIEASLVPVCTGNLLLLGKVLDQTFLLSQLL